jgi:hypothetical protein
MVLAVLLYTARRRPLSSHSAGAVDHRITTPDEGHLLEGCGDTPHARHLRRWRPWALV